MATSILLKFLTLKWNISRTVWCIEVSDGSFFCIFHALSFELNFFRSEFPFNKFAEANSYHFTPLHSLHDNVTDTDDNSDLVAHVDPDTLTRIVRTEVKNGKVQGIDNVHNFILKKEIGTGFYKLLARDITISLKL